MDSVALWLDDDENLVTERVQLRAIRDNSNVFSINDKSFVHNFRLNKQAFQYVLNTIIPELSSPQKSTAIPPIIKLAAALKLLGQGGYQHQIGQDQHVGLSQQSMSRCLIEVCKAIEKTLCPLHITFSSSDAEETEAKLYFYEKCGIPGVLFAIDGTHIQMIRPARNEHLYYNRKLKHSMNAMVMCDHKMRVRAVDARYGGACHDSHVWNLSSERRALRSRFDNGERGMRVLGDSGYPLEPWMLTPYRNAGENSAECRFNNCHAKGRSIIERLFGLLKGRFRCLLAARELHYAPQKVSAIMNVCCALHNICLQFRAELQSSEIISTEDVHILDTVTIEEVDNNMANISRNLRDEIRNSLVL